MKKIKITADGVLDIIDGIFTDTDINITIDDTSAPESWQGKTIAEILNVEYYTFKHRPTSTEEIINQILKDTEVAKKLAAVNRAFCLLSLGNIERLFSKDNDMLVLSANLEYYIQTSKVKLLEYLIEDCNIALSGLRVPVTFDGDETRKAIIIFDRPNITDIQTATIFGEMALVDIAVNIIFYPDAISYSDYTVQVSFVDNTSTQQICDLPLSSFSFASTMTLDPVPYVKSPQQVGSINLSRAITFVLVFDGYNNAFVNHVAAKSLGTGGDNNELFQLTITRNGTSYTHDVIIKDHQVIVAADTSNEIHTLTLVTRGK